MFKVSKVKWERAKGMYGESIGFVLREHQVVETEKRVIRERAVCMLDESSG